MADKKAEAQVSGSKNSFSQIENACMSAASIFPLPHFKNWIFAYFHPEEMIEKEKANAGFGGVVVNAAIAGVLVGIAMMIVMIITALFNPPLSGGVAEIAVGSLIFVVLYPIAMVVGAFLVSLLYFIIAKVLGGKGGYMPQTYGLTLISCGSSLLSLPLVVLSVIPCLGMIFSLISLAVGLYAMYSQYRLIKALHSLSSGKAAAVIIVPILIIFAIAVVFVVLLAGIVGAALMGAAVSARP